MSKNLTNTTNHSLVVDSVGANQIVPEKIPGFAADETRDQKDENLKKIELALNQPLQEGDSFPDFSEFKEENEAAIKRGKEVASAHMQKNIDELDIPEGLTAAQYRELGRAKFAIPTSKNTKENTKKAIQLFNKAIELDPYLPWAHNDRGKCFRKRGKLEDALNDFDYELGINLNPITLCEKLDVISFFHYHSQYEAATKIFIYPFSTKQTTVPHYFDYDEIGRTLKLLDKFSEDELRQRWNTYLNFIYQAKLEASEVENYDLYMREILEALDSGISEESQERFYQNLRKATSSDSIGSRQLRSVFTKNVDANYEDEDWPQKVLKKMEDARKSGALYQEAKFLLGQEKYQEAEDILNKVIDLNPKLVRSFYDRAECRMKRWDFLGAWSDWKSCAKKSELEYSDSETYTACDKADTDAELFVVATLLTSAVAILLALPYAKGKFVSRHILKNFREKDSLSFAAANAKGNLEAAFDADDLESEKDNLLQFDLKELSAVFFDIVSSEESERAKKLEAYQAKLGGEENEAFKIFALAAETTAAAMTQTNVLTNSILLSGDANYRPKMLDQMATPEIKQKIRNAFIQGAADFVTELFSEVKDKAAKDLALEVVGKIVTQLESQENNETNQQVAETMRDILNAASLKQESPGTNPTSPRSESKTNNLFTQEI